MVIAAVSSQEVLQRSREVLGLDEPSECVVDNAFAAGLLRHAAGFLCPCSPATLRTVVLESLQYLVGESEEELIEKIDDAIEGLVIGGDLLELHHVAAADPSVKGTWLFAAPPSYIVRPSGSIFLTGIVADRDTYLPQSLMSRIHHDGYTRAIMPEAEENLTDELATLGLQELNQNNWLRTPKPQSARDAFAGMEASLSAQGRSGHISDLRIIDPAQPVSYYIKRWTAPKRHTGMFVGRRPQEYGAPLWCFVELENGEATKLLDFPQPKSRWRGCDDAWRLQMAIDSNNGDPQRYRVRKSEAYAFIDFYSPIPSWAERRLMIFGRHAEPENCLLSYRIPHGELAAEEEFLRGHLWLSPVEDQSAGEG